MSRVCEMCGRKSSSGRSITRRGLAKKKGGVGKKTTGITKRWFKPNLQRVRTLKDGRVQRVRLCTRCLRTHVVKPSRQPASSAETAA